jgi:phosphatidylglycerol:prolipoprotein diacylglycerol transferase
MWPTLYTIDGEFGQIPLNTWGLMVTMAFLGAALVAHRRLSRVGIDPDLISGLVVVATVAGLAGARLLHFTMAEGRAEFFEEPSMFFDFRRGGFAFYGGFALAGAAGAAYAWARGTNVLKFADVTVPTVMLGLAIGRVGCFFAGCCHGADLTLPADATPILPDSFTGGQIYVFPEFPFVAQLTEHGVGVNGRPVYPTQAWEVLAGLVIFGLGSLSFFNRRFDGQATATVLMLYAIWRPINESLRGDTVRGTDWGFAGMELTTSQAFSIPVFLLGAAIVAIQLARGARVAPEKPFQALELPRDDAGSIGSAPRL